MPEANRSTKHVACLITPFSMRGEPTCFFVTEIKRKCLGFSDTVRLASQHDTVFIFPFASLRVGDVPAAEVSFYLFHLVKNLADDASC
ncbi:hypothetical protein CFP56_040641 [Quercus suber]|uniref:Uncharacterized protein n=1 Tax=Quercus suber TaxID=58331 RepID=A0AAW0IX63_QUESU